MTKNTLLNLFKESKHFSTLPESYPELKQLLNYNPHLEENIILSKIPGRKIGETDRAGWRGYDRVYSYFLTELKDQRINFLEIGIHFGYGHLAWKRFFKNGKIYGIDINDHPERLEEWKKIEQNFPEFAEVNKIFMNSTKPHHWDRNFNNINFDVIIDDGSHKPDNQLATFNCAWSRLKPGGRYFIEDVTHRFGDYPLYKLHGLLEKLINEGHTIDIYNHTNVGLIYHYKSYLSRERHEIDPSANDPTEYIVCIKKNG